MILQRPKQPQTNEEWIRGVRSRVLRWGRRNFAEYPWRATTDGWLTLAAEVLLQRTRAVQARAAYELLASRYATPDALLHGGRRAVRRLTAITGLHGRAGLLIEIARRIRNVGLPTTSRELRAIRGIGAYIAGAWLSLHRGQRAAIVDSNVYRWLGRMTGQLYGRDPRGVQWVNELADRLTPRRAFRAYNYAVLDFTMQICTPRNPRCSECPVRPLCITGQTTGSYAEAGNPKI
jgi:A/G-specific adenine glycosylase